ncbi:hypothetical protein ACGFNU_24455 [Spirillospora sp. NPDC048911]|uniref:hypothetical protein n=1 Tax=Spirillospora sp. NPDC048911 TaxID=3364527 RepID=UPI003719376F
MDDNSERRDVVALGMIAAYGVILKVLAALPVPIALPELMGSMFADEVHEALVRAHQVIEDVPMDEDAMEGAKRTLVDWIAASEMMFSDAEDPETWKVHFIEIQVTRILSTGKAVIAILRKE